jgi:hypothetical protein
MEDHNLYQELKDLIAKEVPKEILEKEGYAIEDVINSLKCTQNEFCPNMSLIEIFQQEILYYKNFGRSALDSNYCGKSIAINNKPVWKHYPGGHLECNPTGRTTYRELRDLLNRMSDFQLDCDVTIEDPYNEPFNIVKGELTICGPEHKLVDFYPTIRILYKD